MGDIKITSISVAQLSYCWALVNAGVYVLKLYTKI